MTWVCCRDKSRMAAFDITDAEKCFAEIKNLLDAPDSMELPFDDRFLRAFGEVFKVPYNTVKEMEEHLKKKLDPNTSGTVNKLKWASFHSDWQRSYESMIVKSLQKTLAFRPSRHGKQTTLRGIDRPMAEILPEVSSATNMDSLFRGADPTEAVEMKMKGNGNGGIQRGILDGVRFELKLTFPVEFGLQVLKNIIVRYSEKKSYDLVLQNLKEDTAQILEGINALRVAKLKTAGDKLGALYGEIQLILDSSNISSKDLEKKAGRLQNDAAMVLNFADEAFNTVKNVNEQIAAVQIAMCAIPVKYIDENDPRHVSKALEDQIKKLLMVKAIKRAIDTQDAGGALFRESREKLIYDVLRLVYAEEAYAYSKGISRKSPLLPQSERFLFNTNDRSFLRKEDERRDLIDSWASSCACELYRLKKLSSLQGLTQLKKIDLSGCAKYLIGDLSSLSGCTQLRELNLFRCWQITGTWINHNSWLRKKDFEKESCFLS
uniref:Uncharacterized protein n=1 Tax=Aureoumbra lagunensis TaxID=44058 RepID=A0A6S8CNF4_9STRA